MLKSPIRATQPFQSFFIALVSLFSVEKSSIASTELCTDMVADYILQETEETVHLYSDSDGYVLEFPVKCGDHTFSAVSAEFFLGKTRLGSAYLEAIRDDSGETITVFVDKSIKDFGVVFDVGYEGGHGCGCFFSKSTMRN